MIFSTEVIFKMLKILIDTGNEIKRYLIIYCYFISIVQ